jgi:hypothetical protein
MKPEEKQQTFDEVVTLLSKYAPPFEVRRETGKDVKEAYSLWSNKPAIVHGRERSGIYFAGLIQQKNYVGFYYMPVYTDPERKSLFKPELLGRLKGKSCFYLTKLDPELKSQVKDVLEDGFKLYKERGWV